MHLVLLLITFCLVGFASQVQADMIDHSIVKLQALDKSTARTITLEAKVGTTIEYGSIFIKIKSCRKSEPLDKPESASFLQIWEVPINSDKSEWVFSGWMFASSPALSAMDHPVYDVWVLDCLKAEKQELPEFQKLEKIETPKIIVKEDHSEEDIPVVNEVIESLVLPPETSNTENISN